MHPLACAARLRDNESLFVRLGRYSGSELPEPLSARAVYKTINAAATGFWALREVEAVRGGS